MPVSVAVMVCGVAIPFTPLGVYLGFTALPPLYFALLAATVVCYLALLISLFYAFTKHFEP